MKSHSELQVLEPYFSISLNGCIVYLVYLGVLEVFSFGFGWKQGSVWFVFFYQM